jgi:hypothetical protein
MLAFHARATSIEVQCVLRGAPEPKESGRSRRITDRTSREKRRRAEAGKKKR